jgi:hypothetical protein
MIALMVVADIPPEMAQDPDALEQAQNAVEDALKTMSVRRKCHVMSLTWAIQTDHFPSVLGEALIQRVGSKVGSMMVAPIVGDWFAHKCKPATRCFDWG